MTHISVKAAGLLILLPVSVQAVLEHCYVCAEFEIDFKSNHCCLVTGFCVIPSCLIDTAPVQLIKGTRE